MIERRRREEGGEEDAGVHAMHVEKVELDLVGWTLGGGCVVYCRCVCVSMMMYKDVEYS